ncbi:MAG: NosD domain-containing protein, partial [Gammaproteobacteria bacterium]
DTVLTLRESLLVANGSLHQSALTVGERDLMLNDARAGFPYSDMVRFHPVTFPAAAPATIALSSGLPELTVTNLDTGFNNISGIGAGVVVDGQNLAQISCLKTNGTWKNIIEGLQIRRCPYGIHIDGGYLNGAIGNNRVGGSVVTAQRNVLRENGAGILFEHSDQNLVVGNHIGTNPEGNDALANNEGIFLLGGSDNNAIGGDSATERNVISGNTDEGILIDDPATGNLVVGNYIGTDALGTSALPNQTGVWVFGNGNAVGGSAPAEGNLISGNGYGVQLTGASNNTISGNRVGTDVTGTLDLSTGIGISLESGSTNNVIGGSLPGARNLISGNDIGVVVDGLDGTGNNFIRGNYIGTDASGASALPNATSLLIFGDGNTIGGAALGQGNLIAGSDNGVRLASAD